MRKWVPTSDTAIATPAAIRRPTTSASISSAATVRSSNGITSSPMVCVVSWPLPGDDDDVAGAARRRARVAMAWRRSGWICTEEGSLMPVSDRFDDGVRVFPPRVVRCEDYTIRQARRHLTHRRPLGRIAIAAGAEHDRDRSPPRRGHGRPAAPARARRACARSRR